MQVLACFPNWGRERSAGQAADIFSLALIELFGAGLVKFILSPSRICGLLPAADGKDKCNNHFLFCAEVG
jgi:hypothetical protein